MGKEESQGEVNFAMGVADSTFGFVVGIAGILVAPLIGAVATSLGSAGAKPVDTGRGWKSRLDVGF